MGKGPHPASLQDERIPALLPSRSGLQPSAMVMAASVCVPGLQQDQNRWSPQIDCLPNSNEPPSGTCRVKLCITCNLATGGTTEDPCAGTSPFPDCVSVPVSEDRGT